MKQQHSIVVRYEEIVVGQYYADLLIDDSGLVELKAVKAFEVSHTAQCLNYLKATGLDICLLINFGISKVGIKRVVL